MLRERDTAQVRQDALAMAAKKLAEGCGGCAQGYLDLARRHGASDDEIAAVLAPGAPAPIGMSRRDLLAATALGMVRVAGVAAAGAVVQEVGTAPGAAFAQAAAAPQVTVPAADPTPSVLVLGTDSANQSWLSAVAPDGTIGLQVAAANGQFLRTADASQVLVLST